MPYAAKSADNPDAAWVQPGAAVELIGGIRCSQDWLAGLGEDDACQFGLVRAEVVGMEPIQGLADPPKLEDVGGVPTWVWTSDGEAALRDALIARVKAEATARITRRYSLAQQANMNMRATELVETRFERELTTEEEGERQGLKAAAAWIKSVRLASNEIEANLPTTAPELRAIEIGALPNWPA